MSRLRVALGIRNSHNPLKNLRYAAWGWYTRFKSQPEFTEQDIERVDALRKTGIAVLGVSDVDELARIVDAKLSNVPPVDGCAQMPRRHNPLIVPHLFKILQEHRGAIEAFYRSHFRVNWFEVQRITPGQISSGSSFGYHTDDTPNQIIKLFIYLNDTFETNGAFRAFDYQHTDELLRRGMFSSVSPGEPRRRAQRLVPADWESRLTVVEGRKGTVFLFDNNLIHKGTLPRQGTRTHVSMELMPSITSLTEASLYDQCEEPITEYFPANPFRWARHGKRVRAPLRRRVRRYLNRIGVDVVRRDRHGTGNRPKDSGFKQPVPEKIIIGGGDYVYGSRWHNIEFVTPGYADKYKGLPSNIDIAHDLTAGKPFSIRDATIAAAYTSHVIEHLKDDHVSFLFRDTWRVLKPGAYFRISCPNVDLYVRAFLEGDLEFFHYRSHPFYVNLGIHDSLTQLFLNVFATALAERSPRHTYEDVRGTMESLGIEQAIESYCRQTPYDYVKSHYHVNWFNPSKLERMLKAAGFGNVYVSALGQSFCPDMRDLSMFDTGDPKISLFVECRK